MQEKVTIEISGHTSVPNKLKAYRRAKALMREDTRESKYDVRRTMYEVKELGATELRGDDGRMQIRNDVCRPDPRTREVEALSVRRASATRIRIGIVALFENFIGTGVIGTHCRCSHRHRNTTS